MSEPDETLTELQKAFRTIEKIVSKRNRSLDASRKRILSLQECIDRLYSRVQAGDRVIEGLQTKNKEHKDRISELNKTIELLNTTESHRIFKLVMQIDNLEKQLLDAQTRSASAAGWQPMSTIPTSGEFLLGVWEGSWENPRTRFRVYHASGYPSRPSWAKRGEYRTEEGEAYKLFGWMPIPAPNDLVSGCDGAAKDVVGEIKP